MASSCGALLATAFALLSDPAAADALTSAVGVRESLNATAIAMFLGFVVVSLGITWWAARQGTSMAKDFCAAGAGLKGFQNGLAIAGDYTSAATFLGVTALVYTSGYDGMIYAIGFLVGFPMILFLIAEPLRNLGRYTFADAAAYRLSEVPIIMAPGGLVKDPISAISLGLALIFGTAGLPHILTVRDARAARTSVLVATGFISVFYTLLFVLGFGAIALLSANPEFRDAAGGSGAVPRAGWFHYRGDLRGWRHAPFRLW